MHKLKRLVLIQFLIILILLLIIGINIYIENRNPKETSLITPRIKAGILPAQSLLIFNFNPLEKDIRNYTEDNNFNISLYVLNIRDGASFGINQNQRFEAFSLNKVSLAIMILKKVERGELSLDTNLKILNEDLINGVGSGTLYQKGLSQLSVKELLRYMLQESDNTAFSVLSHEIGIEDGIELTNYLDYYQNDISDSEASETLQITPKSTANLFLSLYLSTILQPEHSELILRFLTNTSFDIKKYAQLPDDVIVSQKYGSFYYENQKYFHSCGIMYLENARIFYCLMTQDLDKELAYKVVGNIVNKIYSYIAEKTIS